MLNANEAAYEFAYADKISADYVVLRSDEINESGAPNSASGYAHAYSRSVYAMDDGTICSIGDNSGRAVRYMVDWREW